MCNQLVLTSLNQFLRMACPLIWYNGRFWTTLAVRPAAADFPRGVCLTVSRNHAVFLLYPHLMCIHHGTKAWYKYILAVVCIHHGTKAWCEHILAVMYIHHGTKAWCEYILAAVWYTSWYECMIRIDPRCHVFKGLRPVLERFVVPMLEGACETGSQMTYCSHGD